jgi:glycine/D-amino acid oxidase-like deaminating enzyme
MKPVLVVGHGLAGAILAQSLLMRGIMVHCVDARIKHSASSVAAGLINPFIGPKLNTPEQFNECMKANLAFFQNWEIESWRETLTFRTSSACFHLRKTSFKMEGAIRIFSLCPVFS